MLRRGRRVDLDGDGGAHHVLRVRVDRLDEATQLHLDARDEARPAPMKGTPGDSHRRFHPLPTLPTQVPSPPPVSTLLEPPRSSRLVSVFRACLAASPPWRSGSRLALRAQIEHADIESLASRVDCIRGQAHQPCADDTAVWMIVMSSGPGLLSAEDAPERRDAGVRTTGLSSGSLSSVAGWRATSHGARRRPRSSVVKNSRACTQPSRATDDGCGHGMHAVYETAPCGTAPVRSAAYVVIATKDNGRIGVAPRSELPGSE